MRFVPVKSIEQQAARALEGSRELIVKQQTQLINSVRGRLAQFDIVAAQGRRGFTTLAAQIKDADPAIPQAALAALRPLVDQAESLATSIAGLEAKIVEAAKADAVMRLLATIPGIGDHRPRDRCRRRDRGAVRLGPGLRRLDRPDPPPALERRQAAQRREDRPHCLRHPNQR